MLVKFFIRQKNVKLTNNPSQSLDLNSIEQIWAYIKKEFNKNNFDKKKEFIKMVKDIWYKISLSLCQSLVLNMTKCVRDVIEQK